jgi:excisionase family DNA binding protein
MKIRLSQAANILGVPEYTLKKYADSGELPSYKSTAGGTRYFKIKDLDNLKEKIKENLPEYTKTMRSYKKKNLPQGYVTITQANEILQISDTKSIYRHMRTGHISYKKNKASTRYIITLDEVERLKKHVINGHINTDSLYGRVPAESLQSDEIKQRPSKETGYFGKYNSFIDDITNVIKKYISKGDIR